MLFLIRHIARTVLLLAMLTGVAGCKSVDVSTPSVTAEASEAATQTEAPTLEPTVEPSTTPVPYREVHPNIILGLGVPSNNGCPSSADTQIWRMYPPDTEPRLLVSDPAVDYYYPAWSPDGAWIALLASHPEITVNPVDPSDVIYGTDGVWIMHPDGSDLHQVGDSFPSALVTQNFECFQVSGLTFPLVWSPDSQNIILAQSNWDDDGKTYEHDYYVIEVISGKTRKIVEHIGFSLPVWLDAEQVMISDQANMNIATGLTSSDIQITKTAFPAEVVSEHIPTFLKLQDSSLIFAFSVGSTYLSPRPQKISLWEFDTLSQSWKEVTTLNISTWGKPKLGRQLGALCDEEKGIFVIDPVSWQILGQSRPPTEKWLDCGSLQVLSGDHQDIAFVAAKDRDNGKAELWVIDLLPGSWQPRLLTSSEISLPSGYSIFSIDGSLQPEK